MAKIQHRIRTPHAAIKIWNYVDRIGADGATLRSADGMENYVQEEIVSTISCSAIQTTKAKRDPVGSFNFLLAPTRNWTAVITPGSWCVVMMSNDPITKEDFKKANPRLVKMIGKIETVRTVVSTNADGSRSTQYAVSGQDWGQVFHSNMYVDPLISDPAEPRYDQGNELYIQLIKAMDRNGTPALTTIRDNLSVLLQIFGRHFQGLDGEITRLPKSTYNLAMPQQMVKFLGFDSVEIMKQIELISGALQGDGYTEVKDGLGWIDPYSLVGSHNLWQVLQDNSNYALNELFSDIVWEDGKAKFALFNRIKPFAFRKEPVDPNSSDLRSQFKYVPEHRLDDVTITSVNAGTNWRDKYNFVEIKPEVAEFKVLDNWVKQKAQAWDDESEDVFDREGFRPLILAVKQLPFSGNGLKMQVDYESLTKWTALLKEWYFDTHRLLNGQIVLTGSSEYITVGNNIMFDAGILGVKSNFNEGATTSKKTCYLLAQVESVKNTFQIAEDGTRTFQTTIDFVRGIIVDEQKNLVGEGILDTLSISLSKGTSKNTKTVVSTSFPDNPEQE